jgi:Mn-dependent DtxR family transcriptional regulator
MAGNALGYSTPGACSGSGGPKFKRSVRLHRCATSLDADKLGPIVAQAHGDGELARRRMHPHDVRRLDAAAGEGQARRRRFRVLQLPRGRRVSTI